jgi:hypothetical protein
VSSRLPVSSFPWLKFAKVWAQVTGAYEQQAAPSRYNTLLRLNDSASRMVETLWYGTQSRWPQLVWGLFAGVCTSCGQLHGRMPLERAATLFTSGLPQEQQAGPLKLPAACVAGQLNERRQGESTFGALSASSVVSGRRGGRQCSIEQRTLRRSMVLRRCMANIECPCIQPD